MKWFDELKENAVGSDFEAPGNSHHAIARIADETLDSETMKAFIMDRFGRQKMFGEFLGVGESTVTGWMKNESFPAYAKRAALAVYYAEKHYRLWKEAKNDALEPKVVSDGDRYMIVRFDADAAVGEVLARDLPDEENALKYASGPGALELAAELAAELERYAEGHVEADPALQALLDKADSMCARAANRESERERKDRERAAKSAAKSAALKREFEQPIDEAPDFPAPVESPGNPLSEVSDGTGSGDEAARKRAEKARGRDV